MKKKIICLLFAALLLPLLALPTHAAEQATVASGTCGENLTWALTEDGTLTISGTGDMENYFDENPAPWHSHQGKILSVVVKDGVTNIGNSAFKDCTVLTGVTIPDGVTSIRSSAFYGCSSLTEITLPDGVTYIGMSAFNGNGLTSITLPDSVTQIESYAFSHCNNLTDITIPNSVTGIGDGAFGYCGNLKNITVSDGNLNYRSVDGVLFDKQCATLICCPGGKTGDYTIPTGVTSIGANAFNSCSSLTDITIPNSVTSIGWGAFDGCSSLTSVSIPNSVTSIGNWAFSYCGLTDITIPDSVTNIDDYVFAYCRSLTGITIPDSVLSIGEGAFSYCSSLTSITIPDGVTSIGNGAFSSCSSLTSITISNSVTSIGYEAFQECSRLTGITIPDSVTSIGSGAFWDCSSLTDIYVLNREVKLDGSCIPAETTIHGYSGSTAEAYASSNGNQFVAIGQPVVASGTCGEKLNWVLTEDGTLTIFGTGEFTPDISWDSNRERIRSVVIENGATSIGDFVFAYCSSLTDITIPNSVTSIGNEAFYSCESLASITIPDSVTSIGNSAFEGCSSLTSITLPNSMTSIGDKAFNYCSSLTGIIIPDGVTSIDERTFGNCESLTSVTLPNSVTSIGGHAFDSCSSLTGISIPNSVTSIAEGAFSGSGLTSITLPDSVTSIGDWAFYDCTSLTDIYVLNREALMDYSEIPTETTIHGYSGSTAETYANSNGNTFVPLDSEIRCEVTSVAMNLGNSLSMIFYVPVDNVSAGDYAQITKSYADGRDDVTVKVSLAGAQTAMFAGKNCYMVGFDGIAAKEMNDNVSCVVCNADGTPVSEAYNATVKAYAEAVLAIDNAKLKTLMVDLLNYGAAAQDAFGYDTGNPANAGLTEEQKGYATKDIDVNALAHYQNISGIAPAEIALLLKSNTRLMLYYPAAGLNANMVAKITYTDHHGNEKVNYVNVSDFGTDKAGKLCLIIDTLRAADYKTVLTVEISDGENLVSSNEVNLVMYCVLNPGYDASIPLAKYCQAAYDYFHK